jgi:amino acid transporter
MNMRTRSQGLGRFQLFTLLFGTIVGVGWIVATGMWIGTAGPIGALIAFGAGALVMWLIGLCFAEMMALYPDANGSMAYVFESFGERASAVAGWFLVLSYAATCAWFFATIGWLIESAFPWTAGAWTYATPAGPVRVSDLVLGLIGAVVITLVNLRGISASSLLQDVLVIAKLAMAFVLFTGAAMLGRSDYLQPMFSLESGNGEWSGIVAVAVTTPFFFAGFDVLPQAVRDRRRDLPLRSIASIVGLATLMAFVFYGGAILSTGAALPRAALDGRSLPVIEAFRAGLGQPWLAVLVVAAGLSGVLTGWNANLLSGARVLQGMAQAGVTLPYFAKSTERLPSQRGTPARATWFVSGLGVALGALGRESLGPIVEIAAIPLLIVFALVCAGVIRLRFRRPDAVRPYRVPGGLPLPVLALALALSLIAASFVSTSGVGIGFELVVLLVWSLVGLAFWILAAGYRSRISAGERKRLVLEAQE